MKTIMGALKHRGEFVNGALVLLSPLLLGGYLSLVLCPHFLPAGIREHTACSEEQGPAAPAENTEDKTCCAGHALKALPTDGPGFVHPTTAVCFHAEPSALILTAHSAAAAPRAFHPPRDRLTYLLNHSFLL